MPNPRRAWRRAWSVDLDGGTAVHEPTGARVKVEVLDIPDAAEHGYAADLQDAPALLARLSAEHGQAAAQQMIARLVREGLDIYQTASKRRDRERDGAPSRTPRP